MTAMPHLPSIAWSWKNQMQRADKGGGGSVYYTYDASGERVRKVWEHGGTVDERIYLGGYEIYRQRKADGVALERQTLHVMDGPRRVALVETKTVDAKLPALAASPVQRFQLGDRVGSVTIELDERGQLISYEEFHPYGTSAYRAASALEASRKRYRYTGDERDEETGLDYHGARYYAPWLARWTATDPSGLVDGTQLYRYCRNSPIQHSDNNGREPHKTIKDIVDSFLPPPAPPPEPAKTPEDLVNEAVVKALGPQRPPVPAGPPPPPPPPGSHETPKGLPAPPPSPLAALPPGRRECFTNRCHWPKPGDRPLSITGVFAFFGFEIPAWPLHSVKVEELTIVGKTWDPEHPETARKYHGGMVLAAGEVEVGPVGIAVAHGVEQTQYDDEKPKHPGDRGETSPITTVDILAGPVSFGGYKTHEGLGNYVAVTLGAVVGGVGVDWGEGPPPLPEPWVFGRDTGLLSDFKVDALVTWLQADLEKRAKADQKAERASQAHMRRVFDSTPAPPPLTLPSIGEGVGYRPKPLTLYP